MVQLLDFINSNGIKQNLWCAFYGNCGQSWKDLYGSENTNEIKFDHITIWWDRQTMDNDMFTWMMKHSDHNTLNSEGKLMFHFFLNSRKIDERYIYTVKK